MSTRYGAHTPSALRTTTHTLASSMPRYRPNCRRTALLLQHPEMPFSVALWPARRTMAPLAALTGCKKTQTSPACPETSSAWGSVEHPVPMVSVPS